MSHRCRLDKRAGHPQVPAGFGPGQNLFQKYQPFCLPQAVGRRSPAAGTGEPGAFLKKRNGPLANQSRRMARAMDKAMAIPVERNNPICNSRSGRLTLDFGSRVCR